VNLKLDENLGHTAAELFRQGGHGVETVHSQRLSGAPDAEVIAMCRREQRCLVTLDLDFSNPLMFKPWKYAGIAVLRLPARPTHDDLLLACRTLLAALARETITGKLWTVQRGRIREYHPDRPEEEREDA
jgi:predicted nuclease of predicted toxin-antitoxin system